MYFVIVTENELRIITLLNPDEFLWRYKQFFHRTSEVSLRAAEIGEGDTHDSEEESLYILL